MKMALDITLDMILDISSEKTDEQIALAVQNGDAHSFSILVERYEKKMMRYARKFLFGYADAEDLVQEIFIKAYMNIQGFDTSRKFSPWIYRIAHNEFINAIRKKGREPLSFFDPDTLFPHPTAPDNADRDVNEREIKKMLDGCLDELDPKYREPLVLYYYEDMDYQSIADIMRIPISTVGIRLKRGKAALRQAYKKRHPNRIYEQPTQ